MSERFEEFGLRFFTRRNALLFLLSFLGVLGFGLPNRAALFGAEFILILLLVQFFTTSDMPPKINVRRLHTPRSFENEEVVVDFELQNGHERTAYMVEMTDSFPPAGEYAIPMVAPVAPAKSIVAFRYRQVCTRRRGPYIIGPVKVRFGDSLGLFHFSFTVDHLTNLLVYPQAAPARTFGVLGEGTHFGIGEEVARRVGRSVEFERLRQYRSGDPVRLIHWPSTARTGEHYVKVFEQNVVTEVTVYCDLFLLALAGIGDLTSVEYRIKVAASVATETIRRKHLVKIVAVKKPLEQTRMGGGSQHLITILDWLALLKAGGRGSFEAALIDDARIMRRGSTCVLVMSTVHIVVEDLLQAISLLRMRNIQIIAVLVDDRSFLKLRAEQEELFRSAPSTELLVEMLRQQQCVVYTLGFLENVSMRLGASA